MPECLMFPWVSFSVVALVAAAAYAWFASTADAARRVGTGALIVSTMCLLAARLDVDPSTGHGMRLEPWADLFSYSWFGVDPLNAIPLPLFSGLSLGVMVLAPRRKVSPPWVSGLLLMAASTLAAYAAENLLMLVIGWTGSALPLLSRRFFTIAGEQEMPRLSRAVLLGSIACFMACAAVLAFSAVGEESLSLFAVRPGTGGLQRVAFILLVAAVFLRKGLLPFQSWIVTTFERGPLLPLTLLVNGHLGAFIVARVGIPVLPDVARLWLPLLGDLGLVTAFYAAMLALVERQPRRLLALIAVSQASFLLVGLESSNAGGIAGALVHWQVVAVATTVLASVFTALEARIGTNFDEKRFLGLAIGAPRLAVFFLIGGLALVGLPLTLGFIGEDLLMHGTLTRHPHFGMVIPIVTAMNACSLLRLFSRLFLGQPDPEARNISDALPRERWVLTVAVLFLLIGGIYPGPLTRLPAAAAEQLAHAVSGIRQVRNH